MRTTRRGWRRAAALALAGGIGAVLPIAVPSAGHADTPLPPECSEKAYGFAGATDLTLNGLAAVTPTGDGTVLRVTPVLPRGAGSAFTTDKIALHDDGSFSTAFSFRVSNPSNGGADGLVFTVQNVANNVGGAGGGMGYEGVDHSVGIEFDDWYNPPGDGIVEPDDNHVGIDINGDVRHSPAIQSLYPGVILDAGNVVHAWVDYDGATDNLAVRVSSSSTRPAAATLSYTVDLPALLGSAGTPADEAFVGFSAGTGYGGANFDVINWSFRNCFQPVGVDTSPVVDAGGPYTGYVSVATPLAGTVEDDKAGVVSSWSLTGLVPGSTCAILNPGSATAATINCNKLGTYELTLTATDSIGQVTSDTATYTVVNRAPVAGALTLTATSACAVNASLAFTDPDTGDTHTASFAWGDSTSSPGTVTESGGSGTATASHTYAAAGTYAVTATISDGTDADSTSASYATKNQAGAFLPPINAAGTRSTFRLGSTIPVKIVISDCSGHPVTTLSPIVSVTKLDSSGGTPTEEVADVVPTNGRQMFWADDHYQFNLSTKRSVFAAGANLTAGTYRITVSDPSLIPSASVDIDLG
jgi:hypothetical protein